MDKLIQAADLNYYGNDQMNRVYSVEGLSPTVETVSGGGREPKICVMRGQNPENPTSRKSGLPTKQTIEIKSDCVSNALTTVQKDNLVAEPVCLNSKVGGKQPSIQDRIYDSEGLAVAQCAEQGGRYNVADGVRVRKLTPLECWRLMGASDEDYNKAKNAGVSKTQLYRQAGNGIVKNVLMAIFGQLYGVDWKPIVYGEFWKSESDRINELPIFNQNAITAPDAERRDKC